MTLSSRSLMLSSRSERMSYSSGQSLTGAAKEGESAEPYITALCSLVETCEYGALKEEMLRDRIVVGIRDTSEYLQMTADLTLKSAKRQV